jgi:hypothetical protein
VATPIVIPNVVEVVIHGMHAADLRVSVIHYRYSSPVPTSASLSELTSQVASALLPKIKACVSSGTFWDYIRAVDIGRVGGAEYTQNLSPVVYGTSVGEVLPGANQIVLTKRSVVRSRRARGRIFMPDLSENVQNDGRINAGQMNLYAAVGAEMLRAYGVTQTFRPCIASRTGLAFYDLSAVTWDDVTDVLYKRGLGKRVHRRRH